VLQQSKDKDVDVGGLETQALGGGGVKSCSCKYGVVDVPLPQSDRWRYIQQPHMTLVNPATTRASKGGSKDECCRSLWGLRKLYATADV